MKRVNLTDDILSVFLFTEPYTFPSSFDSGLKSQLFANHTDQVYMRQPAATLVQLKRSSVGLKGISSTQQSDSESPTMQRKIPPSAHSKLIKNRDVIGRSLFEMNDTNIVW